MTVAPDLDLQGETLAYPRMRAEIALREGKTLTVTPGSGATGKLTRRSDANGGPDQSSQAISALTVVGPFHNTHSYLLECYSGQIHYSMERFD